MLGCPSNKNMGEMMAVYCVTHVQMSDAGNVTGAMLQWVNTDNPQQFGAPQWFEAHQIVDLLLGGDIVQSTFSVGGHRVLGPEFQRKVLAGGVETIELAEDIEGRRLTDMSVVADRD